MYFDKLISIREYNNLTQKQLAKILHTSQSNYSRWERSVELIPLKKLSLLCNYFKLNMDYVAGLSKHPINNGQHNYNNKKTGNNIKIIRKKYNITQNDLANYLNTTQSTISAYECGKTTLLTAFALQIAQKFNISLDWLCGRNNDIEKAN